MPEVYHIPNIHRADQYIYLVDDYIDKTGTEQEVEDNIQETESEQMPAVIKDTHDKEDELIATRT